MKKKNTKPKKLSTAALKRRKKQHPKVFLKRYAAYMPLLLVTTFSLVFGSVLPAVNGTGSPQTLAYATEMSVGNLLAKTNAERTSRGLAALSLNSKLNSSSAAKANHMKVNDYWAHVAPDGTSPWYFFDSAGYNYQKAGENLAYGFGSSSNTITGWMNSPSHRDNMLDAGYNEVGFGFINSSNFIGNGEQTIVVAHYGKSLGAATAAPPAPAPETAPAVQPQSLAETQQTEAPPSRQRAASPITNQEVPAEEPPPAPIEDEPAENELKPLSSDRINQPFTSETVASVSPEPVTISRLQQWTNGDAPWSTYALGFGALAVVIAWIIKHALLVKKYVLYGEHFVAHHPAFDAAVVFIAAIAVYLSQSTGVVL